jgi:hypothetical protein
MCSCAHRHALGWRPSQQSLPSGPDARLLRDGLTDLYSMRNLDKFYNAQRDMDLGREAPDQIA